MPMPHEKSAKVGYWISTLLFILPTAGSGIPELLGAIPEQTLTAYQHLGYPLYLARILGLAKILGALAILTGKSKTLKEWAYAGFTFNLIGAAASHALSGDVGPVFIPLSVLVLTLISYFQWHKIEDQPVS